MDAAGGRIEEVSDREQEIQLWQWKKGARKRVSWKPEQGPEGAASRGGCGQDAGKVRFEIAAGIREQHLGCRRWLGATLL